MSTTVSYWCHQCRRLLNDTELSPEFTCLFCNSGFVELDSQRERVINLESQPPRNAIFTAGLSGPDVISQLFSAANNALQQQRLQQQEGSDASSAPRDTSNALPSGINVRFNIQQASSPTHPPSQHQQLPRTGVMNFGFPDFLNTVLRGVRRAWNPGSSNTFRSSRNQGSSSQSSTNSPQQGQRSSQSAPPQPNRATPNEDDPNHPSNNPAAFLNNLLSGLFPPNATIRVEVNQFTPSGDFLFGGNLDEIINQLLNSTTSENVRIPESDLALIPKITVLQERVDDEAQCTTCMEMFILKEEVCRLDCDHIFHENCILPWLRTHNTCPVCRGEVLSEKWRPSPMQTFHDEELD